MDYDLKNLISNIAGTMSGIRVVRKKMRWLTADFVISSAQILGWECP